MEMICWGVLGWFDRCAEHQICADAHCASLHGAGLYSLHYRQTGVGMAIGHPLADQCSCAFVGRQRFPPSLSFRACRGIFSAPMRPPGKILRLHAPHFAQDDRGEGKASVRREKRPPCAKGALPEGRWGIVSAGRRYNPSVTLRVPPPFTQGRLLRTADGRPYTRPTGALCMRTVGDAGPYGV